MEHEVQLVESPDSDRIGLLAYLQAQLASEQLEPTERALIPFAKKIILALRHIQETYGMLSVYRIVCVCLSPLLHMAETSAMWCRKETHTWQA